MATDIASRFARLMPAFYPAGLEDGSDFEIGVPLRPDSGFGRARG